MRARNRFYDKLLYVRRRQFAFLMVVIGVAIFLGLARQEGINRTVRRIETVELPKLCVSNTKIYPPRCRRLLGALLITATPQQQLKIASKLHDTAARARRQQRQRSPGFPPTSSTIPSDILRRVPGLTTFTCPPLLEVANLCPN